jgi:hypothetical protein
MAICQAGVPLLLAVLGLGAGPGERPAHPDSTPALPLAAGLLEARAGSFAEYRFTAGGMAPVRQRFVRTRATGGRVGLEIALDGDGLGPMGTTGAMIIHLESEGEPSDAGRPRTMAIQVPGRPPMLLPAGAPLAPVLRFERLDPGTFVGPARITVPAGTFRTRLHRWLSNGATVEAWVSRAVQPLGIVRLRVTPGAGGGRAAVMDLVRTGTGATSSLRGPPRPFDEQALAEMLR